MMTEWRHQTLKTMKPWYTNWKYIQVTKSQKKKGGGGRGKEKKLISFFVSFYSKAASYNVGVFGDC